MGNLEKLLALRSHPSFGMMISSLFTVIPDKSADPPLPNPGQTGTMTSDQINTLYTIASYPLTMWNLNSQYNRFDLGELTEYVGLKTEQVPSYFTVYNQTLTLYQNLVQQMGQTAALTYLYTPNPATPPPNWDAVRFYTIQQFLYLFITSGNFMTYGWVNYPGWMGGPYDNPNDLPYRSIND